MKKINATIDALFRSGLFVAVLSVLAFANNANAQCTSATSFGGGAASPCGGAVTLTTCAFGGEFSPFNNPAVGATYQFTGTGGSGNFLTIRQGATVLAFGNSPVSAMVLVAGNIQVVVHTNAACGTESACHTLTANCTSCAPAVVPANDLCTGGIALALPGSVSGFTTCGPTVDAVVPANCGTTTGTAPGVWYNLDPTVGNGRNRVRLSNCTGTSYDSKISVYSGACAALTCVAGNDDFCGAQSQVDFAVVNPAAPAAGGVVAPVTHRILQHGFSTNSGAFTLASTQLASILDVASTTQTACNINTNLYSQTLVLTYAAAPATGTLVVNGQNFPITGSPQTVVLTDLNSDGMPVNVTAAFSADAASSVTVLGAFTAPARCNFCTVVCPGNIGVTLDAGECNEYVNYNITTTGDCTEPNIDFQNRYAPATWTVGLDNSNGSVNAAGAPASIVLNGSNNGSGGPGQTNYTHVIAEAGTVSFDYSYTTVDGATFDPFGYTINGVFTPVVNAGPAAQAGTVSVAVPAGAVFGFSQRTVDNIFGAGITTITNFVAPPSVNVPSLIAGLASGESFPIGTTTVIYSIPDGAGGVSQCQFNVTINAFPNPTNQLACNDEVQISLDENCEALIGADDVLEALPISKVVYTAATTLVTRQ